MAHDEHHDSGHHHHDDESNVPLYTKPIQSQKWGDVQCLPHTNWGDHFFDLFYVAGAYNLGNLLRYEPTPRGLLYFVGCLWPLINIWNVKMFYDGRFETRDDLWHRLTQIAKLVALATAVLHIRTVTILSTPEKNLDMFIFCISVSMCYFFGIIRFLEILFGVDGQPVAKVAARRDMGWVFVPFISFLVAAVIAAVQYNPNDDDISYEESDNKDGHRFLAGEYATKSQSVEENDIPVYIAIAGCFLWTFGFTSHVAFFLREDHKMVTVPVNVTFTLHRIGEWVMLAFGESVLSLLIVQSTNTIEYYETFFCGIASITLLQYLHFRSQPHSADHHALRRSKEAGMAFSHLMQIYSASLIILGASYKMLLYEFTYKSSSSSSSNRRVLFPIPERWLAGGADSEGPLRFETSDRQQRVANFFCGSLAAVWLCLDLLILTHRGLSTNTGRCRCKESGSLKWAGILLVAARVGLIVFMATLSRYLINPTKLVFVGLGGIIAQVLLRFAGSILFGPDLPHGDEEDKKWPNITMPQAVPQKQEDQIDN